MQFFKKGIGFEAVLGEKRLYLNDLEMRWLKHKAARIDFTNEPELLITDPGKAGEVSTTYHKQQRANAFNEQRILNLLQSEGQ